MIRGPATEAHARWSDPDTSHEAAEAIRYDITAIQRQVLRYAIRMGLDGFSDIDLYENFKVTGSTYRTRRHELCEIGYLKDTGRRIRQAGKRRHFIIWAATPRGIAAYNAGIRG